LIEQVVAANPARPRAIAPAIPRDLETIILKATARDPALRYQSAADLAADLRRFLEDRPVLARRAGSAEQAWRWCRRNPAVASLLSAVLVVFAAGAGIASYFAVRESERAAEANEQRQQAVAAREDLAHLLYVSEVNGVQRAWEAGDFRQAKSILDRLRPLPGEPDRRGFEWHFWNRQFHLDSRVVKLQGWNPDGGPYTWTAWGGELSRDGRRVAVIVSRPQTESREEKFLYVWETATGRPPDGFKPIALVDTSGVRPDFHLNPDGSRAVVFNIHRPFRFDRGRPVDSRIGPPTADVFDTTTGRKVATLEAQGRWLFDYGVGEVPSPSFSPDGEQLVGWLVEAEVPVLTVWSAADGKVIQQIKVPDAERFQVLGPSQGMGFHVGPPAFTPDGKGVAAAVGGKRVRIRVWELSSARVVKSFDAPLNATAVEFSPNGELLATIGTEGTNFSRSVELWDLRAENPVATKVPFTVGSSRFWPQVVFSPDGRYVVVESGSNAVQVRRVQDASLHCEVCGLLEPRLAVAFTADGTALTILEEDGTLRTRPLPPAPAEPRPGRRVEVADQRVRSLADRFPAAAEDDAEGVWFAAFAYHPEQSWLASLARTGSQEPRLIVHDLARQAVRRLPFPVAIPADPPRPQQGGNGPRRPPVESLVFSPRGDRLAYFTAPRYGMGAAEDLNAPALHRLVVVDLASGARLFQREWDTAQANPSALPIGSCEFSPDGRYLHVSRTTRGRSPDGGFLPYGAVLWDLATGAEALHLTTDERTQFEFSPDSTLLAAPDRDAVRVVRVPGGELVTRLAVAEGTDRQVTQLAFSPDGQRLACATRPPRGGDCHLSLWAWESGTLVWRSRGMLNATRPLSFSPDGSRLGSFYSTESGARAVLWDVRTAREVLSVPLEIRNGYPRMAFADPHRVVVYPEGFRALTSPRLAGEDITVIDATPVKD
jgi:WD40 repeat protein